MSRKLTASFTLTLDDEIQDETEFVVESNPDGDLNAETSAVLTSLMQYLSLNRQAKNVAFAADNQPDIESPLDTDGDMGFLDTDG